MSEDYYGKAERQELTAQFILGALVMAHGNGNEAATRVKIAWDIAEIFQKERDERVSKMRNAQATRSA